MAGLRPVLRTAIFSSRPRGPSDGTETERGMITSTIVPGWALVSLQLSTEFLGALAHPSDANADAVGPQLHDPFDHAFPVIPHLDYDFALPLQQADPTFRAPEWRNTLVSAS